MNGIKKDIELNKLIEEHFEKQLQQTNYWLSFAEAKNVAIIVFNVTLIGLLFDSLNENHIMFLISSILFVVSCLISLYSFLPNMNSKAKNMALPYAWMIVCLLNKFLVFLFKFITCVQRCF